MNAVLFFIGIAAGFGVGYGTAVALIQTRLRAYYEERDRIRQAETFAKLEVTAPKTRPTLKPPSDYYGGSR